MPGAHVVSACPHVVNLLYALRDAYGELRARARRLVGAGLDEHGHCALRRRFEQQRDAPLDSAAQAWVLGAGRWRGGVFWVRPRQWARLHRTHLLLQRLRPSLECRATTTTHRD